jgi:hypothetical protein
MTTTRNTLPEGSVRIPDHMFHDLQVEASGIQVTPNGHVILSFADGVTCDCERKFPRNANQWIVTSSAGGKAPTDPAGPITEYRRLRIALNDGRREFRMGITAQKAICRDTHRTFKQAQGEWQAAVAKLDQLRSDLNRFEQDMNRRMDAIRPISTEVKS